ncbi:hypothetical protein [Tabrizicola aquatica]|uniref:hypothetical protein n=1 Tax=Tabrizicola aquatica TaxID=909926 RepID=UPI003CCBC172
MPDHVRPERTPDSTLVKALARAFRWKRMLESGEFATIAELAEREGIAAPYLTRTMRLSHLSPDLVESILEGRQPRHLTLEVLWKAAQVKDAGINEAETCAALARLDPLWDELFPAEQARIVTMLVEGVDIGKDSLNIRLRVDGLGGLAREMFAGEMGAAA